MSWRNEASSGRPLRAADRLDEVEQELLRLLELGDYAVFMRAAVAARKNILVSGPTGSGKTTCTKALIREISPDERLITIEDAQELVLDRHPNHVRLFYSKDDQGVARVTPRQLLECCLRMKPRIVFCWPSCVPRKPSTTCATSTPATPARSRAYTPRAPISPSSSWCCS